MVDPTCAEIADRALDIMLVKGMIVGLIVPFAIWMAYGLPEILGKRTRLISKLRYLKDKNKGIVTVTDLTLEAEVSPDNAEKFLKNFAQKTHTQADVDPLTGERYYPD